MANVRSRNVVALPPEPRAGLKHWPLRPCAADFSAVAASGWMIATASRVPFGLVTDRLLGSSSEATAYPTPSRHSIIRARGPVGFDGLALSTSAALGWLSEVGSGLSEPHPAVRPAVASTARAMRW